MPGTLSQGLDAQGGPDIKPHLATITSSSENQWIVDNLLTPALIVPTTRLSQSQVWVGGSPGCNGCRRVALGE